MITNVLKKINHLNYLKFRVWIDFLVSYDLINVYWIWNSVFNKIIWIRDVIFNEKIFFDENIKTTRLKFKKIQIIQNMNFNKLAELFQWLNKIKTERQSEFDMFILNNNIMIMSDADNNNLNDYNSHENQL